MPENNNESVEDEGVTSLTNDEFQILKSLFRKGLVEADIEDGSLVLSASLNHEWYSEFARLPLEEFASSIAYIMRQRDEGDELMDFMATLGSMQTILATSEAVGSRSHILEVIDQES